MADDAATRAARARFQSGLLAWLRQPDDAAGLREMIAVLRELAATDGASGGVVWRSAEAFLSSLLAGTLKADDGARQLCRRIERHLAAGARGETVVDAELCAALFAYVSGKTADAADAAPASDPAFLVAGLHKAMGNSLAKTAELLPLIAGAVLPRHSEETVSAWLDAVKRLDQAWQAMGRGDASDCRPQATALVAAALVINTAACLQLAEALAAACGGAEAPGGREHPSLRAAIAAALEIAGERDAPNHRHFDQRAAIAAARLAKAEEEVRAMQRSTSDLPPDSLV